MEDIEQGFESYSGSDSDTYQCENGNYTTDKAPPAITRQNGYKKPQQIVPGPVNCPNSCKDTSPGTLKK